MKRISVPSQSSPIKSFCHSPFSPTAPIKASPCSPSLSLPHHKRTVPTIPHSQVRSGDAARTAAAARRAVARVAVVKRSAVARARQERRANLLAVLRARFPDVVPPPYSLEGAFQDEVIVQTNLSLS